ncbi:MAG: hypothetical protein CMN28_05090 [Salinisphaeraceae bacterium]|nr:hypothetical protein [Salinisphaeraceae bacterium]
MVVANTTVSNNQATGDGGGVYQDGGDGDGSGTTEVAFSTITQNTAGGIGGGLGTGNNAPVLTVDASIIAENSDSSGSESVIMVATYMPQEWNPGVVEIVGAHPQKPAPALNWQTPAIAGGALLGLLSLVSVGRIRRRTRVFLLATSAALVLTACGGGGGGGSGGGVIPDGSEDPMNPLVRGDIQFVVDTLLGSGMEPDLIGDGLPVNGPGITIQGLPETQDF